MSYHCVSILHFKLGNICTISLRPPETFTMGSKRIVVNCGIKLLFSHFRQENNESRKWRKTEIFNRHDARKQLQGEPY